jgi:peptidoglycan/LPS O-acetylase OafA/YrhL
VVSTYSTLAGVLLVASLSYRPDHALTRLLSQGPFLALGTISYGLYVWHYPVVVLLADAHGLDLAARSAIILATSLALALLSWRYLETRFHQPQAQPVPVAVAPPEPARADAVEAP